jgi:hypothetical protein
MPDRIRFAMSFLLLLVCSSPVGAAETLLTIPNPLVGLENFGRAVANVGDQNGDGFDDFLVGSDGFSGRAFLYYGGSALDGQYDLLINPDGYNLRLGYSVTSLGDFNGDGHEDFAVGQPGSNGTTWAQVRVFFGGPGLDPDADLLLLGPYDSSGMGWAVSGGRDLDGDGHPDLVASARYDDTGTAQRGRVYVYFGGPGADDQADLVLDGLPGEFEFGTDVELVEDVTADGHDDLVVVATGRALVYAGGPALDAVADWSADVPQTLEGRVAGGDVNGDGSTDIVLGLPGAGASGEVRVYHGGSSLDADVDLVLEGRQPGEKFGRMVEMPGDVNGDGVVDLVVGAAGTGNNEDRGLMYVYRGGDPADPQLELVMAPSEADRQFGRAAASIGDIDGDGVEELVVGGTGYVWVVDELFFDCDDDDRPDLQQVADGELEDCDQDGVPDLCQVALWIEEDCDQSGLPDACDIAMAPQLDCDQNGEIDACEIAARPSLDCDDNTVLDSCQLVSSPEDDCDGDGQIDVCAIAADPTLDCDGEGTVDTCQLLAYPELDCDGDGQIDVCAIAADPTLDCDLEGTVDTCQLLAYPELDCDGDGDIDACTIAADPSVDCDRNGQLDVCDIASIEDWDRDCDVDGQYDRCEIASDPAKDSDTDGTLDACQLPGELALYADAGHTTHNLEVTSAGVVGPFELVLHLPPGSWLVEHVELTLEPGPQAPLLDLELLPPGATDIDGTEAGLVATWPGLAPDPQGDVLLARVWCLVSSPVPQDQELRIVANVSAFHDPDFGLPLWRNGASDFHVVSTTRSGWINRTFNDCNENGQPDDEDITLGRSSDLNGNGIPDECEATASPPSEASWRLALEGHPNPFNPATTLRLTLPDASAARVDIVDLLGRRVRTFRIAASAPGLREILWRGTDESGRPVASGVYIARLVQGSRAVQCKLVLLR